MTLKEYIINSVSAAVVLTAGSTLISIKVNDAKQDQNIARLETLNTDVNGLRGDLTRVDQHLSRIEGKLQQQDLDHHG